MTGTVLARRHIALQKRIRDRTSESVGVVWDRLGAYNREDIPRFVQAAVPVVAAGQTASARATTSFIAKSTGGIPVRLDPKSVTGAAVRNGTEPGQVYARPFVSVFTMLKNGSQYQDAVNAGRARAVSSAATDVQLTMRQTLVEVGTQDSRIVGYARVPDSGACEFCQLIAGQRYTTEDLLPVHSNCGCGVDIITAENRGDFFGNRDNDLDMESSVAVAQHGELGPVLVDPSHNFTSNVPASPARRMNAGDLGQAQGEAIARSAMKASRGEITDAEHRAFVRSLTGTDSRGRRRP